MKSGAASIAVAAMLCLSACSVVKVDKRSFDPYLGAAELGSARATRDDVVLSVDVNTAFPSSRDDDADAQHLYSRMRFRFAGATATARRVDSKTDLRGNGADGSYSNVSVWTDTWRATMTAPQLRRSGTYLLVITGCHADRTNCGRTVVPVCVKRSRVVGVPFNQGRTDAKGYGRQGDWLHMYTCRRPMFDSVGAEDEPQDAVPAPQKLPADIAKPVSVP